jgi:AcrR family transcriptional regulator
MLSSDPSPSAREVELLDAAYAYVLKQGMSDLSLRPLAAAIGSSPRVLLYLFGSKEGLIRALLSRARDDELAMLAGLRAGHDSSDLAGAANEVWSWLADPQHRDLLVLWVEGYARSLLDPDGPWSDFAHQTVTDWLDVFASYQPADVRRTVAGQEQRTALLALLRGALLDLLASRDDARVTATVRDQVARLIGS